MDQLGSRARSQARGVLTPSSFRQVDHAQIIVFDEGALEAAANLIGGGRVIDATTH